MSKGPRSKTIAFTLGLSAGPYKEKGGKEGGGGGGEEERKRRMRG